MVTTTALDPRTAAAIREALTAATGGRIADARRIGEDAIATGGDAAALNAMLGTLCLRSDDFEGAVRHLTLARAKRPQDIVIAFNLPAALVQLGAFAEALDAAPAELAEKDDSLRLYRVRGFAAQSLEDLSDRDRRL